jgi:hypothetical protein
MQLKQHKVISTTTNNNKDNIDDIFEDTENLVIIKKILEKTIYSPSLQKINNKYQYIIQNYNFDILTSSNMSLFNNSSFSSPITQPHNNAIDLLPDLPNLNYIPITPPSSPSFILSDSNNDSIGLKLKTETESLFNIDNIDNIDNINELKEYISDNDEDELMEYISDNNDEDNNEDELKEYISDNNNDDNNNDYNNDDDDNDEEEDEEDDEEEEDELKEYISDNNEDNEEDEEDEEDELKEYISDNEEESNNMVMNNANNNAMTLMLMQGGIPITYLLLRPFIKLPYHTINMFL